jgi:sortase A
MAMSRLKRVSPSTFAAFGMVAAAGGIAWIATGGDIPAMPTGSAESATMAAIPPLEQEPETFASVSIGGLPTRIVVPSAGIDAPVTEVGIVLRDGVPQWETAWHAAGHHMDSALPGQPGNVVISGHVSVANAANVALFKNLNAVASGDVVEIFSGDDLYRYTVSQVLVVPPDEVKLLRSKAGATITLITCTRDLKARLVVTGTLSEVVPAGPDA